MTNWSKERHEGTKERCEAATPGPWGYDRDLEIAPFDGDGYLEWSEEVAAVVSSEYDADFIVTARTDLPDALAEIERLQREINLIAIGRSITDAEADKELSGGDPS